MRNSFFSALVLFVLLNVFLPYEVLCQNAIDSTSSRDTIPSANTPITSSLDTNAAKTIADTSAAPKEIITLPTSGTSVVPSENPAPLPALSSSSEIYPVFKDTTPMRPIDIRFSKYKCYNAPDSSFFNVLKIKNNTDKPIIFSPKINVPEGWNHLFTETGKMTLKPGDSAYIPIRIIIPREAKGGITYITSAQLISPDGKSLARGYSYVNIPKKSNWNITVPNKVIYLNNLIEYENVEVQIHNKGNGEEKLKIEIKAGRELYLVGAKDGSLSFPINVPSNTDTVLYFQVRYEPMPRQNPRIFEGWLNTNIQVKALALDTSSSASIWFKYIESSFVNTIGKGQSPLNVVLVSRNLLTISQPQLTTAFFGSIDFCNQKFIQYNIIIPSVNRIGDNNMSYGNYIWKNTQMIVSYNTPVYKISLGDQSIGYQQGVYGRGINGEYKFKNHLFSGGVVYNLFYPTLGVSLGHDYSGLLGPVTSIRSGVTYSDDTYNKIKALSVGTSAGVHIWKGHMVGIMLAASTNKHYYTTQDFINPVDPLKSFNGFAGGINYNTKINKYLIDFSTQYYSKNFVAGYTERFLMSGRFGYVISKKYIANLRASHHSTNPNIYILGQPLPENKFSFNTLALDFSANLTSKIIASAGPSIEFSKQSRYNSTIGANAQFATLSERLSARINYRPDQFTTVTPFINIGWTKVTDYNDSLYNSLSSFVVQNVGTLSPYFNVSSGMTIRKRMWGINMYYYYGPYNLYSQETFFYGGNFHRSIRIMPYFEKYFLNKKLRFYTYNSYMYDPSPNVERLNVSVRLDYFFNKGWSMFTNSSLSTYSRYDEDGTKYNNRSYFMDLGVKKSFDIPQPCVKFYDLKVIFFVDLNNNKAMDQNEKGLPFILSRIDKVNEADSIPSPNKEPVRFITVELISDKSGEISYIDIPTGNYQLQILPFSYTGDLYSVLGEKIPFSINSSHLNLYIPYAVSNKVKGKIMVERDEFSSEGSISPENIRITATDTMGNAFFTLTDKDGSYVLQVPKAGTYRITTNSEVFGDNFFIEQDEFLVDFNGFKEYEVIFKFTEKNRAININGDTAKLPGSILNGRNVNGHTSSTTTTGTTSGTTTTTITGTTSGSTSGTANTTGSSTGGDSSITSYPTVMDTIIVETGTPPSGISATGAANNPKMFFYALPIGEGITYRVQLSASSSRIAPSKLSNKFPGASKIKEYSEGGYYKYTSGEFTEVSDVKKYKTELRTKGFKDAFIVAFKNNKRIK